MVVYFAIFIWGVVMGMSLLILLNKISLHLQTKNVTEEYNTFFTEIKDLIDKNSCRFLSRYNNNVNFRITTQTQGKVDLILFLDKGDVAIFKKGDLLYSTHYTDKTLVKSIVDTLQSNFKKQIMDCVLVMNNVIDRKTITRLNPDVEFPPAFQSEVEEEEGFTIDGILDRINEVGLENLTDKEKKFLYEYQNKK